MSLPPPGGKRPGGEGTGGESPDRQDPRRDGPRREEAGEAHQGWTVFGVTSLGVLLCFLNSSTLQVALPTLARAFDAGPMAASWILLAYMLVNTVCILAFGRLSDLVGRRRLYLLGLVVFMAGSLGCALAPGIAWLIAGRAVQGLGAAAIIANNAALLADAFPQHRLAVALGYNSTISAVAQVSGPALGGAMIGLFGWPAVFLFNLPFGLVSLALGLRVLRRLPPRAAERFDALGGALSALMLGGLVLALSPQQGGGAEGSVRLAAGAVALLALPAFLVSQARRRDPLVDLRLFRDPGLASAFAAVGLVSAAQAGTGLVAALFLQTARSQGAFGAGLRVMSLAAGMIAAAQLVAWMQRHAPATLLGAAGAGLMAAVLALLALLLSPELPDAALAAALFAIGLGNTTFMSPCTGLVMLRAPPERRGMANGLRSTLQNAGMLTGVAVATALVARTGLSGASGAAVPMVGYVAALAVLSAATALASAIMAVTWRREA